MLEGTAQLPAAAAEDPPLDMEVGALACHTPELDLISSSVCMIMCMQSLTLG